MTTTSTTGLRVIPMVSVECLEVTRTFRRTLRYRDAVTGRDGAYDDAGQADRDHCRRMLSSRRWRKLSLTRFCYLSLRIRAARAWLPRLDLSERQARALLAGDVINVCAMQELAAHAYGHIRLIKMTGEGRHEETRVELPLQLLKTAFARALALPADRDVARLDVADRHQRWWRPHVKVRLHGGALAMYRTRYGLPAEGGHGDLRGTLRWLAHLGRGYSAHRGDPVTVNLSPDGDGFYFWLEGADGRKRAFDGGVVWHRDGSPAGGVYSVHT
jgi:hypothetical protein